MTIPKGNVHSRGSAVRRLALIASILLCGISGPPAYAGPGALDLSFDPGTGTSADSGSNYYLNAIALQADGRILIGGSFTIVRGVSRRSIARLNPDGTVDTGFVPGSVARDDVLCLAIQKDDGKILIAGQVASFNGVTLSSIARLNPDGSVDQGFNPGAGTNRFIRRIALQADGKILIGGGFTMLNGVTRNYIARLNANGSPDTSFNASPDYDVYSIAMQGDKILIGGAFGNVGGVGRRGIARLNADGSIDPTFDAGAAVGSDPGIYSIVVQGDGKIMIGGTLTQGNATVPKGLVARLNPDGSPDLNFNAGTGPNDNVETLAVQADGKVVIGGRFQYISGMNAHTNHIARLNQNGTLDTNFDPGFGPSNAVISLAIQKDGKILIGGLFTQVNSVSRNHIARLGGDGPRPDLLIRNAADAAYIGDDIYGSSDPLQTKVQNTVSGATAVFPIALQNDGDRDLFRIKGSAGDAGWTVRYFDALSGGSDITARVTMASGPTWPSDALDFRAGREFRVEVTPASAVAAGAIRHVLLEVRAASDPTRRDIVRASTIATGVTAAAGTTLISDDANNRVVEVTRGGNVVWQYGSAVVGAATPQFFDPVHVERLANGNTLITQSFNDLVIEVKPDKSIAWQYASQFPPGTSPDNMAGARACGIEASLCFPQKAVRLANGNTLITDGGNCRILEVRPDKTFAWQYGTMSCGSTANKLYLPYSALRLANGNTLIADTRNHRVIEVTPAKAIAWQYGMPEVAGSGANQLNWPMSAVRLANGNTLIADLANNRIIEVRPNQSVAWTYGGSLGSAPGQLHSPTDAVRLPSGNTLVTDAGNQRVIEITPGMGIVWQYGTTGVPTFGSGALGYPPNSLNNPRNAVRIGAP